MGIARKKSHSALKIKIRILGFLGVFSLILSGCEATRETVCRELPRFKTQMAVVQQELQALAVLQTSSGRKLASLTGLRPNDPTEAEMKHWFQFAEKSLKQVQSARDVFQSEHVGGKALAQMSDASLSLVSFHGYISQKKWRKAFLELEKVEGKLKNADALVCAPKPGT